MKNRQTNFFLQEKWWFEIEKFWFQKMCDFWSIQYKLHFLFLRYLIFSRFFFCQDKKSEIFNFIGDRRILRETKELKKNFSFLLCSFVWKQINSRSPKSDSFRFFQHLKVIFLNGLRAQNHHLSNFPLWGRFLAFLQHYSFSLKIWWKKNPVQFLKFKHRFLVK